MVSKEQIKRGVVKFLDSELMPQFSEDNKIKKIVFATGVGIAIKQFETVIEQFAGNSMVKLFKVADEHGKIDIDLIASELRPNIPEEGVMIEIPLMGDIKLYPSDIDIICRYIKE